MNLGGQEPTAGEGKNVLRRSSAGKEINSATRAVMQRTVSRQSSGGSVRSVASATPREKKHFSAFAAANEFDLSHELKTAILESDKALIQAAKKANDVAGNFFPLPLPFFFLLKKSSFYSHFTIKDTNQSLVIIDEKNY